MSNFRFTRVGRFLPVDMFTYTHHMENLMQLKRIENTMSLENKGVKEKCQEK
jgi:hypothetical protein